MTEWEIYWILKLDALGWITGILGTCIVGGFICTVNQNYPHHVPGFSVLILGIILVLISIFLPSTKEMVAIKIVPYMANSKSFEKISKELPSLSELGLNYLKDKLEIKND